MEPKFKLWLPEIKKMTYPHTIPEIVSWEEKLDNVVFLQFIGLQDRQGVDVYEGDILDCWRSIGANGKLRGKYCTPLPVIYCPKWCQFVARDKANKQQLNIWQEFRVFEVIGNVYQNRELLEAV